MCREHTCRLHFLRTSGYQYFVCIILGIFLALLAWVSRQRIGYGDAVIFMVLGMLLFYSGKYGNIFQTIVAGLMAVLKGILWVLLKLLGLGPDTEYEAESEPFTQEIQTSTKDDLTASAYNPVGNALFEVFALCALIGMFIAIIYAIVKYAKGFRKSLDNDGDEIEYLNKDTEKEQYGIKREKPKETKDKNNIQYRKLYKKYAKSKKYMTKNKLSGVKANQEMMPDEITKKLITDDETKSKIITESYEKARYSDKEVSKEDIEFLKKL